MAIFAAETMELAQAVLTAASSRGVMIATAESCTGGLVAAALTAIAGSSRVVERGFVTYSNAAKIELLQVLPSLIETEGAVSRLVAEAMAAGALRASRAGLAVSITGVAGPDGGTAAKPVGLVWFGIAASGAAPRSIAHHFSGNRDDVRLAATHTALILLRDALETSL